VILTCFLFFFRLLTLFRMKKRFRDVFGVTVILMPRLISAVVVLNLIYYFFAIIGMECFGHLSLYNCCKNTTVEQFYANDTGIRNHSRIFVRVVTNSSDADTNLGLFISNSESTNFLTNICYYVLYIFQLANCIRDKTCFGPIRNLYLFSTAQTETKS
jgi:hypothetical protein